PLILMINQTDSIILIGPMGSGKTSTGRILAKEMGYVFADTDEEVVERTGVSIAYIFDVEGESGFRQREHQALMKLLSKNNAVIATGGGILTYDENRQIIMGHKNVVYLKTSLEKQIERTTVSDNRPLLIDADPALKLQELMLTREPLYEEISTIKIDTDQSAPYEIALEIIDKLG
ncbi:MAG TPA: shikimate kinase, partial [Gammaproteobacteria bacterium]|nr:shikimate kinase [Gammaproteobacteria bacterium]